jgi:hypothetical protein
MGEIAEDVVDGTCCQLCGCYFKGKDEPYAEKFHSHGHPVVCWSCWQDLNKFERKQYQRAQVDTI